MLSNLNTVQRNLVTAILAVIVYIVATGVSYYIFAAASSKNLAGLANSQPGSGGSQIAAVGQEPEGPKTESCPLDGDKHTKQAREAWEKRRPLAVMIENSTAARPQSGLTSADVVYEAVAEGGITRFMAVFLCNYGDVQVGPVRSARTYFLDWVSEYDGLYAHVGGANTPGLANALGQIIDYDIKSLNQFNIGFPTYWRDYERLGRPVATEHTMYSTTQKLWAVADKRGWGAENEDGERWDKNFVPWKFQDGKGGGTVTNIEAVHWEGYNDYKVNWTYEASSNSYKRKTGGQDHIDMNNKKQISPKNVVIQFQKESNANDGYENNAHLLYGTKGSGKALIFQNGNVIVGTWNKANRLARSKFLDQNGKEVEFVRGQIWIETVPIGSKVAY